MRNKENEQILIRVITLLDNAKLAERHDEVLDLLHNARRACRTRDYFTAQHYSINALSKIRKTLFCLQARGGADNDVKLTYIAISILELVFEDGQAEAWAILNSHSLWKQCLLIVLVAPLFFIAMMMGFLIFSLMIA